MAEGGGRTGGAAQRGLYVAHASGEMPVPPSALAGLLTGALVWGLIWYPYRVLDEAGLGGVAAAALTYLVALLCSLPGLPWRRVASGRLAVLAAIGLAAGGCNLGYVVAMLDGQVMRVLLLFYLAPLWTVVAARVLLGERIDAAGLAVIALAAGGAFTMLWRSELGLPVPRDRAEWIGLAAGALFALGNVLARKAADVPVEVRSFAIFAGVVVSAAGVLGTGGAPIALPGAAAAGMIVLIGVVLFAVNLAVQHGLAHTPANRAIVIFLVELAVAALSSWLLAGEALDARGWAGGAMIVAASLLSGRIGTGH
ncbi:MAG: DMT family transporter [Rhodocyclaceae bacterium]